MTSITQHSNSAPQEVFISPQNQIMPQILPETQPIANSIPISQQTYPPSQAQAQAPDNIDPSNHAHTFIYIYIT